jgi:branched-chain amino acid transport system substrate-binding protein
MKARSFLYCIALLALAAQFIAPAPIQAAGMAGNSGLADIPAVCSTDPHGCAEFLPGEDIKIGFGGPITGSYAVWGIDIWHAEEIAITDGGNIQGWNFALSVQDDLGTPTGGATSATVLAADPKVVAIAGHVFSGATLGAIPVYESAGIPMMSPSATNPGLTQTGSKVFNRVAYNDVVQGQFAAQYLFFNLGIRKLAVMHDGDSYGQGLAEAAASRFKLLGGSVVATQVITPGQSDYTAPLSAVATHNPEALYYGGFNPEAATLVNQMSQSGLNGVVFFSDDGVFGQDFISSTGSKGEGAYVVGMIPPVSSERTQFDDAYTTRFGVAPGFLTPYTWNGYDAAAALISVIKKVAIKGDNGNLYIPRGALVTAVRSLKDYKGLIGTLTCDATGECNQSGPNIFKVQGGSWVPVGFAKQAYFEFIPPLFRQ